MSATRTIDLPTDSPADVEPLMHLCREHGLRDGECLPDRSTCASYCGATKSHYDPDGPMPRPSLRCVVCMDMWRAEARGAAW